MDEQYWWDVLSPLFAGRKVILAGVMLGGSGPMVAEMKRLGASDVFLLAQARGTGPVPEDVPSCNLDVHGESVMDSIRACAAALADLPAAVLEALDRFDPDRSAIVVGDMFNELAQIGGRTTLAHRRAEWVAVEDKSTIDARWDRWGIDRAPCEVVPATEGAVTAAARRLDRGEGTVWVADNREGWNGGAEYARWVRHETDRSEALAFLTAHSDRVRVMPFLEGVPCSAHGIVFDDDVAVFRPMEQVALRVTGSNEFFYAGLASFWDPSPDDREQFREVVRRAGDGLRADVGYRGAFTVDGVLTADGFLPTELNARAGGGLGMLARALPDFPMLLLVTAVGGGHRLDYRPRDLEALVVAAADATRTGGTWRMVAKRVENVDNEAVVYRDGCWEMAGGGPGGDETDGWFTAGEAPAGSFVRLGLNPDRWPVGPPVGPAAAAFWQFTDQRLGTGIGPLEAARAVR